LNEHICAFEADVRNLFRRGWRAGARDYRYTGSRQWLPETRWRSASTSRPGRLRHQLSQPQLWQSCTAVSDAWCSG